MPSSAPRISAASSVARRRRVAGLVEQPEQRAVHQAEVVQVAAGHHQLVADPQPAAADRLAVGVEPLAQRVVERVDPERRRGRPARTPGCRGSGRRRSARAAARDTSETISSSAAAGSARSIRNRSRRIRSDGAKVGGSPAADRVRALHDHAPRGLAEDVGQPGRRHRVARRPAPRTACRRRPARADRRRRRAPRAPSAPTARSSVTSSSRFAIEVSSTISRSQLSGSSLVVGRALAGNPAERRVDRRGVACPLASRHPASPRGRLARRAARARPGRRPAARSSGSSRSCRCRDRR